MSDSQSINIWLLEVMISWKHKWVFICNLTHLPVQIIFNAWWVSMNEDLTRPFGWKSSWLAHSWRFYLHCGIEDIGSPAIICIVCHQVPRHPSEHGTSSMGKYLLVHAHMAKSNELTESEVSELASTTMDESTMAILKRQASRGITIVRMQKKFIFESLVVPILT